MNDADVLVMIREALYEVAPTRQEEFEELTLDVTVEDLALDSIAIMEMVGCVEDRLETTFHEDELGKIETLRDLALLITAAAAAVVS